MSKLPIRPLIFTDLDGTLLDHDTYSAAPANAFIKKLCAASKADVMPVTSKTQAELFQLDQSLPFRDAIKISENGSVIRMPRDSALKRDRPETVILGSPYATILNTIETLPEQLRREIKGFATMDAEEVAHHTGLSCEDAKHAKERQATEPFLWSGTDTLMAALKEIMTQTGIQIQQGGRFFHFTGTATKWQAIQQVVSTYQKCHPQFDYKIIALGDGPNDLEMIEGADYGVIIPNQHGAAIQSEKQHVCTAKHAGPVGWVDAVTDILQELGLL